MRTATGGSACAWRRSWRQQRRQQARWRPLQQTAMWWWGQQPWARPCLLTTSALDSRQRRRGVVGATSMGRASRVAQRPTVAMAGRLETRTGLAASSPGRARATGAGKAGGRTGKSGPRAQGTALPRAHPTPSPRAV